ncbi:MAG: hypothetical protein WAQ28_07445 [Bacteroidia bacterium]
MEKLKYILNITDKILLVAITGVIVIQLFKIFENHKSSFENPSAYFNQNYGNDFVTQYGHRFTELKKMFPNVTILSYIAEPNEDFASQWTNFFLTQYHLAPHLVEREGEPHDTILYNLYNSKQIDPATNTYLNQGWHIVKDFNNGLILLAK